MYFLYLDDSGSIRNTNESNFVIGGISIFENHMHWFIKELDDLAKQILPQNPHSVEFHASEIFSRRIPPWNGMSKQSAIEVIKQVLSIVAKSYSPNSAFACVVHKKSFVKFDLMNLAFENLCSRFDLKLKRIYAVSGESQRGLIVMDKNSYEAGLNLLSINFRELGTRWGILRNISEVPYFVDSRASRLVQLADTIAYSVYRYYEAKDLSYLEPILPKFDSEDDKIHGLVHLHNTGACYCPACLCRL